MTALQTLFFDLRAANSCPPTLNNLLREFGQV
jgi:hypothetical protein